MGIARRWVAVGTIVLVATACTGSHHSAAPTTSIAPSRSVAAVEAARRADAVHVVSELVARAVLPPGGTPFRGTPPRSMRQPEMQPELTNIVVRSRLWQLPQPPATVIAFVRSHPTPGLARASGTGTLTDHGRVVVSSLTQYQQRSFGAGVDRVQLIDSIGASAHGSLVRLDAMAVWLNARGAGEHATANDRVVTITRAQTIGKNPKSRTLVVTDTHTVARLAALFNNLPVESGGASGCGLMDDGTRWTIAFRTSASASPDIVVHAGVCTIRIDVHGRTATRLITRPLVTAAADLLDHAAN